jgi:hypothetical protein
LVDDRLLLRLDALEQEAKKGDTLQALADHHCAKVYKVNCHSQRKVCACHVWLEIDVQTGQAHLDARWVPDVALSSPRRWISGLTYLWR